jgi:hypothetical protein
MNKIYAIIFFVLLNETCLCGNVFGVLNGNGTETVPYQIQSRTDFDEFCNPANAMVYWTGGVYTKLMCNLDLAGTVYAKAVIAPTSSQQFKGIFDGNNHSITNLSISGNTSFNIGFFGNVGSSGIIKNLGIANLNVVGYIYVGGLVGQNNGTITNCYSDGSVRGTGERIGGLVGENHYGTITSCYSEGSVSGGSSGVRVGGLVGYNNNSTIKSCYSISSVIGFSAIGGLVGQHSYGSIEFCYAAGTVDGVVNYVGGLVGGHSGSIISCFWDIQSTGQSGSSGGKGLTTVQMKTMSIYANANWEGKGWMINNGVDYPRLSWEKNDGSPIPPPQSIPLTGNGTENSPYLIYTADEFALLSWHVGVLSKHIKLVNNIDISGLLLFPIGDLGAFTGTFDGNHCSISNVIINQPNSNYIGLFSCVGTGGQVKNLGVKNINVSGYANVGGLVGYNFGDITACYTNGEILGMQNVGGLVGYNDSGTITSCYADCSVGIGSFLGGLGGFNFGIITACYAKGPIVGVNFVGGFVGTNWNTVMHCYSSGSVSETSASVGGFSGSLVEGCIVSCFWDAETSGQLSSMGGSGKTTAEMQAMETFIDAGWDFVETWAICGGMNYPRLKWQIPTVDWVCPDGVNWEDFVYLASWWMADICNTYNDCDGVDINQSGDVGMYELLIFTEHWLAG